jgi:hypothetical protein
MFISTKDNKQETILYLNSAKAICLDRQFIVIYIFILVRKCGECVVQVQTGPYQTFVKVSRHGRMKNAPHPFSVFKTDWDI